MPALSQSLCHLLLVACGVRCTVKGILILVALKMSARGHGGVAFDYIEGPDRASAYPALADLIVILLRLRKKVVCDKHKPVVIIA